MALRFKRITKPEEWGVMRPNLTAINKNYRKRKRQGRVMFPTSHDIVYETIDTVLTVLSKLLRVGNAVLITTKPDPRCVAMICRDLVEFKSQIQFRFTITSSKDQVLKEWEPGAPSLADRLVSLETAYRLGYKTSVSIEPFLDEDPSDLVALVQPWVTESIWIGPFGKSTPKKHRMAIHEPENLRKIYAKLDDNPLVRWKDHFKERMVQMV